MSDCKHVAASRKYMESWHIAQFLDLDKMFRAIKSAEAVCIYCGARFEPRIYTLGEVIPYEVIT